MMDISKILDFHRMVMLAASQQPGEDETSCGPLCPHPACWESKRRRERGVARLKSLEDKKEDEDGSLPSMSYYNMLQDYGESSKDRYPASFGGRPPHDRSSSMRNLSQPHRSASFGITTAPFATPVSPDKASALQAGEMRVVEVQEVFDKSDLNSRWDETFITKQFLVWVPNPNKASLKKPLAITERGEEGTKAVPKMLMPKDLTEAMVPLHIQQNREDTILFDEWPVLKKRLDRSRSPIFQKGTYPKTPISGMKPNVDSEGCVIREIRERIQSSVRELLSLPREVLVQVLDRTRDSDFVSREKIHGIIQEVLDTMRDGRSVHTGRDLSPPRGGTMHTNDMLLQQKAPLHHNIKRRNVREAHSVPQQPPVFQLDHGEEEDKGSSVDTAGLSDTGPTAHRGGLDYTRGGGGAGAGFAKYKKPLPAISADDTGSPQESSRDAPSKGRRKIPSISLGLPELPSGLRHTRAFVYNNKHRPDFSLVPVPSPPLSVRSAESVASDHGTTLHVNVSSMSDRREAEYVAPNTVTQKIMEADRALHGLSPTLSTHVPKAPAGTPATFQSPTKMFREFTAASGGGGGDSRGMLPSREITMSPGHKICVPGGAFADQGSSSPDDVGLSTIRETGREQAGGFTPVLSSQQRNSATGKAQLSEASPPQHHGGGGGEGGSGSRAQVTSPEDWPQVTEPTFDAAAAGIMGSRSESTFLTEHSLMAEHGSGLQRGRSDLSSRGSERNNNNNNNTLARRILDGGAKVESPAPPPPSPEPKEFGEKSALRGGKRENKSRESNAMEPLIEQSESEESALPENKRGHGDKSSTSKSERPSTQSQSVEPVIQEEVTPSLPPLHHDLSTSSSDLDPVSKVMVSHVAPRPSASREKLQQTFLNVDIPAEDLSSLHAEQGSTPLDITPSASASPGKNSPSKLSTPKSSAGPSSPVRSGGKRGGKGRRNGKGRRGSGDGGE